MPLRKDVINRLLKNSVRSRCETNLAEGKEGRRMSWWIPRQAGPTQHSAEFAASLWDATLFRPGGVAPLER